MVAATAITSTHPVSRFLAEYTAKPLLRLAVVGSVDDGKSTLIGRLLYETGSLFEDHVRAVERASAGGELDFSLFTDGLKAEREQGITIDVAYRYFTSSRRKIIIADTPGHTQYTRNMATGASTADAAVILVDARLGVLPQTLRHASIASLLGIPYLAVAINKMDLVGFDRGLFHELSEQVRFVARSLGFRQVRCFPVSAARGDNITTSSDNTPWHDGGTLLQWLESLPHQESREAGPFRFNVQYVARPNLDYRGFAGQVASGTVRVGDPVVVLPSGQRSRIKAIDTFDGPLEQAGASRGVTLRLEDEVDVSRGDVLAHPQDAPRVLHAARTHLVWLADEKLQAGQTYLLKSGSRYVPAVVDAVVWKKNLEDMSQQPASSLACNDIGLVSLTLRRPLVADAYADNRATGAFILVHPQTHDTVAAGMVVDGTTGTDHVGVDAVTAEERARRLGHRGALVVLPHGVSAGETQRALFDAGLLTAQVHNDGETAATLAGAGLVVVVSTNGPQARHAVLERARGLGVACLEPGPQQQLEALVQGLKVHQGDAS